MTAFESGVITVFGTDRNVSRYAMSAAVLLGCVAVGALGHSGAPATRVVFSENFDDDDLGAAPMGVAGPNSAVIQTAVGYVAGTKLSTNSVISVIREDANDWGNCLSIGDFDSAAGGPVASFIPQRGTGDKMLSIGFDLQRIVADPGAILTLLAIDNRTTPGTGRLASFIVTGDDGKLLVAGADTGHSLGNGETYRVAIDLQIDVDGPDYWSLTVWNLADPLDAYHSGSLRCQANGSELSEVQFGAQGTSGAFVTVDNIEIVDSAISGS
jgi:hypothetical protein